MRYMDPLPFSFFFPRALSSPQIRPKWDARSGRRPKTRRFFTRRPVNSQCPLLIAGGLALGGDLSARSLSLSFPGATVYWGESCVRERRFHCFQFILFATVSFLYRWATCFAVWFLSLLLGFLTISSPIDSVSLMRAVNISIVSRRRKSLLEAILGRLVESGDCVYRRPQKIKLLNLSGV